MQLLTNNAEVTHLDRFLRHALILWFCLLPYLALGQSGVSIRVVDEYAIPYMEFLSKAEFDQRFPGQIKSDLAELDRGWYVIYIHEHLNYYFGPILLESTGQDYLTQLTRTVNAAVAQRPDIRDYQLALSYEPSAESSGNSDNSGGSYDGSGGDSGIGNGEPPRETPQPSGFWGFVRRIFGF